MIFLMILVCRINDLIAKSGFRCENLDC